MRITVSSCGDRRPLLAGGRSQFMASGRRAAEYVLDNRAVDTLAMSLCHMISREEFSPALDPDVPKSYRLRSFRVGKSLFRTAGRPIGTKGYRLSGVSSRIVGRNRLLNPHDHGPGRSGAVIGLQRGWALEQAEHGPTLVIWSRLPGGVPRPDALGQSPARCPDGG